MTATVGHSLLASLGHTQASQPHDGADAKHDSKHGKSGSLQASFAHLLGKAAQQAQDKDPATNPTAEQSEPSLADHGTDQPGHSAEQDQAASQLARPSNTQAQQGRHRHTSLTAGAPKTPSPNEQREVPPRSDKGTTSSSASSQRISAPTVPQFPVGDTGVTSRTIALPTLESAPQAQPTPHPAAPSADKQSPVPTPTVPHAPATAQSAAKPSTNRHSTTTVATADRLTTPTAHEQTKLSPKPGDGSPEISDQTETAGAPTGTNRPSTENPRIPAPSPREAGSESGSGAALPLPLPTHPNLLHGGPGRMGTNFSGEQRLTPMAGAPAPQPVTETASPRKNEKNLPSAHAPSAMAALLAYSKTSPTQAKPTDSEQLTSVLADAPAQIVPTPMPDIPRRSHSASPLTPQSISNRAAGVAVGKQTTTAAKPGLKIPDKSHKDGASAFDNKSQGRAKPGNAHSSTDSSHILTPRTEQSGPQPEVHFPEQTIPQSSQNNAVLPSQATIPPNVPKAEHAPSRPTPTSTDPPRPFHASASPQLHTDPAVTVEHKASPAVPPSTTAKPQETGAHAPHIPTLASPQTAAKVPDPSTTHADTSDTTVRSASPPLPESITSLKPAPLPDTPKKTAASTSMASGTTEPPTSDKSALHPTKPTASSPLHPDADSPEIAPAVAAVKTAQPTAKPETLRPAPPAAPEPPLSVSPGPAKPSPTSEAVDAQTPATDRGRQKKTVAQTKPASELGPTALEDNSTAKHPDSQPTTSQQPHTPIPAAPAPVPTIVNQAHRSVEFTRPAALGESTVGQNQAPAGAVPAHAASSVPLPTPVHPTTIPLLPIQGMAPSAIPELSNIAASHASSVPSGSASLVQQATDDPGLSVTVLPHVAHMSLVSNGGDLSLHVRVRDGSADVNVGGSMAPMFDSKAPEMRTALATQGIGLGSFATDQQGGQQHSQPRPEPGLADPYGHPATPARRTQSSTESPTSDEGRIHITA